MRTRVLLNRSSVFSRRGQSAQVAGSGLKTGADRVDVNVLERRQQHPALEIDDPRGGADERASAEIGSNIHDLPGTHPDCLRPGSDTVDRINRA